jgi:hypothetical protein
VSTKRTARVVKNEVLTKEEKRTCAAFMQGVLSANFILETVHEWDVTGKHRGFITKLLAEAEARRARAAWQANISKVLNGMGL